MQVADVFFLGADICQLGVDQCAVNELAREYLDSPHCLEDRPKPIVAAHGLVPGLQSQRKMSKSVVESAIFMDDSAEVVAQKVKGASCPRQLEDNPCTAYVRQLVFPRDGRFRVPCQGGAVEFTSVQVFETAYRAGQVRTEDLKNGLIDAINNMLEPVREHFRTNATARRLQDEVRNYTTRPLS